MRHCLSIVSGHSDMCVCLGAIVVMQHPVARVLAATKGHSRALRPLMTLAGTSTLMARQRAWIVALHGRNAWPRCTTASRPCECYISRVSDFCKRQKRSRESLSCTQRWLRSQLPLKTDPYTLVGPCTRSHKVIQLRSGSIVRPYRHRMYIEIETARSPS
jgi:hypothetical protein